MQKKQILQLSVLSDVHAEAEETDLLNVLSEVHAE